MGLEPTRCCHQQILSLPRLPIPTCRRLNLYYDSMILTDWQEKFYIFLYFYKLFGLLAMYTEEYNGYCSGGNQAELRKLINNGVKYATELGMYVIILVGTPTWSQAGLWYKSVK